MTSMFAVRKRIKNLGMSFLTSRSNQFNNQKHLVLLSLKDDLVLAYSQHSAFVFLKRSLQSARITSVTSNSKRNASCKRVKGFNEIALVSVHGKLLFYKTMQTLPIFREVTRFCLLPTVITQLRRRQNIVR